MSFPALVGSALLLVVLSCLAGAVRVPGVRRRTSAWRSAQPEVVAVRFGDRTVPEVSVANRGRRGVHVVSVVMHATWSDDETGHTLWNVNPVGVRLGRGETATVGAPLLDRLPPPRCSAQVRTTVMLSDGSQVEDARRLQF